MYFIMYFMYVCIYSAVVIFSLEGPTSCMYVHTCMYSLSFQKILKSVDFKNMRKNLNVEFIEKNIVGIRVRTCTTVKREKLVLKRAF